MIRFKVENKPIRMSVERVAVIGEGAYERGYEQGYNKGYSTGYDAGYKSGYDAGETAGYNRGYEDGYNAGSQQPTAILGKAVLGKMKLA